MRNEDKKIGDLEEGGTQDSFGRRIGFLEIDWLYAIDVDTHDDFNDLHKLFGTTCALAELQQELRGEIETTKPLRLVLDRRPFI